MRILLVDDHPIVRAGLRSLLEARGMTVVGEAGDGRAALAEAVAHEPDVVLMDLSMPGPSDGRTATPHATVARTNLNDGAAATKSILAALPRTRVLVLTTFASEADAVRALDAGATGYLLKDAPPDEIVAAVRDVAAGKPAFAPSVAAVMLQRMRAAPAETLTARELEILTKVAEGLSNKEVARALRISEATVKTHLLHVFEKLGVDDRTAATTVAIRRGILSAGR